MISILTVFFGQMKLRHLFIAIELNLLNARESFGEKFIPITLIQTLITSVNSLVALSKPKTSEIASIGTRV